VQKPSLADYSITPETLERVEAVEWKARAWIGWTSFVVYLTAFYYFDLSINFLILTIWSFPILYVCLRPLLDLCFEIVWSDSRKVHNYKKALEKYQQWWTRTQRQFWLSLSGRDFERELTLLFRRVGFAAELTSTSDDKGVDIWLTEGTSKIIVQCKAHKQPVGPAVARELYGTQQHFRAKKAVLASLSGFTKGVMEYVKDKPIELLDIDGIINMQRRIDQ
jgi:HJR/Mrr/RecB family endonuclease